MKMRKNDWENTTVTTVLFTFNYIIVHSLYSFTIYF